MATIGKQAFTACSKLEQVHIGHGIKNIGDKAFFLCMNLKRMSIAATEILTIGDEAFTFDMSVLMYPQMIPSVKRPTLYVPSTLVDDYKHAAPVQHRFGKIRGRDFEH